MSKNNFHKKNILIFDFGSQYTRLIYRRIRELNVFCQIFKWNTQEKVIRTFSPSGIILSGSPESITDSNSPKIPEYIFKFNVPILGICYGMQAIIKHFGGIVVQSTKREFGKETIEIIQESDLLNNIRDDITDNGNPILNVWMSHNDEIQTVPSSFSIIAKTKNCKFAVIENKEKKLYGVQFHPEVTQTIQGLTIIKKFVYDICKYDLLHCPKKILKKMISYLKNEIKKEKVIMGLSGGIDSIVTAILLQRSIGKQLTCIFVDNGLVRTNEVHDVINMLKKQFHLNILCVSKKDTFFNALVGIVDPERKRKIIGKIFIKIFIEQAEKIGNIKWLAQGTIYPDVIESQSIVNGKIKIIKSHHNVGGLPKKMKLKLIEPIRHLFKDEVKDLGKELGLSDYIINRHPFPGPGFCVRIIGEIKKEYCELLNKADSILIEELHNSNLYNTVSQAFTVFLSVRSVGIIGDKRIYGWVIAIRSIKTIDFMTANVSDLPYTFLEKVSTRITNEIQEISRVVYDISSKPPATIEWE